MPIPFHRFRHPAGACLFAIACCATANARAGCGLIPPPFDLTDEPLLQRIGATRPLPEIGTVVLPVMTDECKEAGENAYADMEIVDGAPIRLTISRMLSGKKEIDEFEAFAKTYLGKVAQERKEEQSVEESYQGLYAFWDKTAFDAVLSIQPYGEGHGAYKGYIIMTTRGAAAQKHKRYESREQDAPASRKKGRASETEGAFGASGNEDAAPGY